MVAGGEDWRSEENEGVKKALESDGDCTHKYGGVDDSKIYGCKCEVSPLSMVV